VGLISFELASAITDVETIAEGHGIRNLFKLRKLYGRGHWRKRKGFATLRLANGQIHRAEVHWYEAHGIGRKDMKIKRFLD